MTTFDDAMTAARTVVDSAVDRLDADLAQANLSLDAERFLRVAVEGDLAVTQALLDAANDTIAQHETAAAEHAALVVTLEARIATLEAELAAADEPDPPAYVPPGPTNTGVPAGTVLTVHEGDLTITTPGTIIDSMDIRGFLRIKAADCVLRNSIVRGKPGLTGYMSLIQAGDLGPGLIVEDSELCAKDPSPYIDGIVGKKFTLRRVNIHGVIDTVKITGDDVLVEDSWLHDTLYYLSDPNYGGGPTHDDNVQIQRGARITIRRCVMTGTHNAAIMVTQDSGPVSDLTITGCVLSGGSYTVNVAEKSYGPVQRLAITGNAFTNPKAVIMPLTTSAIATITGNTYADGTPITVARG